MAEMYAVSGETLTGIADAIRSKTSSDEPMTVAAMASAIEGISGVADGFEMKVVEADADYYGTNAELTMFVNSIFGDLPPSNVHVLLNVSVLNNLQSSTNVFICHGGINKNYQNAIRYLVATNTVGTVGNWLDGDTDIMINKGSKLVALWTKSN